VKCIRRKVAKLVTSAAVILPRYIKLATQFRLTPFLRSVKQNGQELRDFEPQQNREWVDGCVGDRRRCAMTNSNSRSAAIVISGALTVRPTNEARRNPSGRKHQPSRTRQRVMIDGLCQSLGHDLPSQMRLPQNLYCRAD
jgi:hypothetical protein